MGLRRYFGLIGKIVAHRPKTFIAISLSIVVFSALVIKYYPKNVIWDFERGYTAPDAPSKRELQAYIDFFGMTGEPWYMGLFAEPKNGSMTSIREFKEFRKFYNYVKKNITINNTKPRKTYMDYCAPTCEINDLLFTTWEMSIFGIGWPISSIFSYTSNIGKHFFKREMEDDYIKSSGLLGLYFAAFVDSKESETSLQNFERRVAVEVERHNANASKLTTITQHSAVGMQAAITSSVTGFIQRELFGLAWSCIFVLISFFYTTYTNQQQCLNSVFVWLVWILTLVFTLLAAVALHLFIGLHFNSLMILMPVVALLCAVHSSLLLLHYWTRFLGLKIYDDNRAQLQEVFAEIGPMLLIHTSPAVLLILAVFYPVLEYAQLFSLIGSILLFNFIFQIFFFTPVLILLYPANTHEPLKTNNHREIEYPVTKSLSRHLNKRALLRIGIYIPFIVLLFGGIYGIRYVTGNMDYRDLLYHTAPQRRGVEIMSDIVWPDYLQVMFYIHNPPAFDVPEQFSRFKELVKSIQSIDHAMSLDYNMMFVNDFLRYTGGDYSAQALNMSMFLSFINDSIYKAWRTGLKYSVIENPITNTTSVKITQMLYIVAFNETMSMAGKARLMAQCRQVVSNFPEFSVIPFDTEVVMTDVIVQAPDTVLSMPPLFIVVFASFFVLFSQNMSSAVIATIAAVVTYYGCLGIESMIFLTVNPFTVIMQIIVLLIIFHIITPYAFLYQLSAKMQKTTDTLHRTQVVMSKTAPLLTQAVLSCIVIGISLISINVDLFVSISLQYFVAHIVAAYVALLVIPSLWIELPRSLTGPNFLYTADTAM